MADLIHAAKYVSFDRNRPDMPGPNDHLLVIGGSGRGKTQGVIIPNMLGGGSGSMLVCDVKGYLHQKYGSFFQRQGFQVKVLDFIHPERSCKYNPLFYISDAMDIKRMASLLTYHGEDSLSFSKDPFWDRYAEILFSSLLGYIVTCLPKREQSLSTLMQLIYESIAPESVSSILRQKMEVAAMKYPNNTFYRQFQMFDAAPSKTKHTILITAYAKIGSLDLEPLHQLLAYDECDILGIAKTPTVFFVKVSDTDRSLDILATLFFTQAFHNLCCFADNQDAFRLPIDVRFILDDFASSIVIPDFPKMLSDVRSRGIAIQMYLQAESQLNAVYPGYGQTILNNCDTFVYLGGNDLETSEDIARRCGRKLTSILHMPYGQCVVMRCGMDPIYAPVWTPGEYENQFVLRNKI